MKKREWRWSKYHLESVGVSHKGVRNFFFYVVGHVEFGVPFFTFGRSFEP